MMKHGSVVMPVLLSQCLCVFSSTARAQERGTVPIPIRVLAPIEARSATSFGTILGVQQLSDNSVIVNDGGRRELVALDRALAARTALLDSAELSRNPYGRSAQALIQYRGDSSLRLDRAASAFLVLDEHGKVAHVIAAVNAGDFSFLNNSPNYADLDGNVLYRGRAKTARVNSPITHAITVRQSDSVPLLRSNFDTRKMDTVTYLRAVRTAMLSIGDDGRGGSARHLSPEEPLVAIDDWALLSDGSIAVARGGNYHVEVTRPNGEKFTSAKLPFDWKRVSDEEKVALIDSARKATLKLFEDPPPVAGQKADASGAPTRASGSGLSMNPDVPPPLPPTLPARARVTIVDLPLPGELPDYYPSIRSGAVKPDRDANLWILPTTSAQSKNGELVYDVVNSRAELFERVRIPAGRSIAGFGRNGVVYLMVKDGKDWYLERTRVVH